VLSVAALEQVLGSCREALGAEHLEAERVGEPVGGIERGADRERVLDLLGWYAGGKHLPSIPARLRLVPPDGGPTGRWLRGVIHARPGSLLWEPGRSVHALPIDLTTATAVPEDADSKAKSTGTVILATSTGQIQLDHDTAMVALLQRLASEQG
jgi:hypothetical protein